MVTWDRVRIFTTIRKKVMKYTFKDLKFKKHPSTKKGILASLEIEPDIFMSVIAGEGFYSTSKKGVKAPVTDVKDVLSFEVGIINENLPDGEQQWDIFGWQTREDINNIIKEIQDEQG